MVRVSIMSLHYDDVIMSAIASQITSLTVVYSTVYWGADQCKHQSSALLAFVWGIHRDRWIPRTKGQLRGKCFHLMTSSWDCLWHHHYGLTTFLNYVNGNNTDGSFKVATIAMPQISLSCDTCMSIGSGGTKHTPNHKALLERRKYKEDLEYIVIQKEQETK